MSASHGRPAFTPPMQSPLPPPSAPRGPDALIQGAWGGAWTVAYGSIILAKAATTLGAMYAVTEVLRIASAVVRVQSHEAGADTELAEFAATFDRGAGALGASMNVAIAASAALGLVLIVAGYGVLRRSDGARRFAIACAAAVAAISVGMSLWWAIRIYPVYETWIGEVRELADRAPSSEFRGPLEMLRANRVLDFVMEGGSQAIHLAAVTFLIVRLAGAGCRAWCGAKAEIRHPIASPRPPR